MAGKRRTLTRVLSNYLRLAGTFVVGLFLVRILLKFDSSAYSVIVLLIAGLGIGSLLRDMVRTSMIPQLGAAHHSGGDAFRAIYNSAIALCLIGGIVTALIFGLLVCLLPLFRIPDELLFAARCFVVFKGSQACLSILLAPTFNMYAVSERMAAYNFWFFMERFADFSAAALLVFWGTSSASTVIIGYGALSAGFSILVLIIAVTWLVVLDSKLAPRFHEARWRNVKKLFRASYANSSIILAENLYFRADALIMNLGFGLYGNLVFGIASQFVSYARLAGMGVAGGLDAVSARVSKSGGVDSMRALVQTAMRMQAFVAFPAGVLIFALAPAAIELWVGDRLSGQTAALPAIVLMVRLLAIGTVARSLGEPGTFILSGARKVGPFARVMLIAAFINPVLVLLLCLVLPASTAYTAPAWAYSILSLVVYIAILPVMLLRTFQMRWIDLVAPLAKPILATTISSAVLLSLVSIETADLLHFLWSVAVFGGAYLVCCAALEAQRLSKRIASLRAGLASQPASVLNESASARNPHLVRASNSQTVPHVRASHLTSVESE